MPVTQRESFTVIFKNMAIGNQEVRLPYTRCPTCLGTEINIPHISAMCFIKKYWEVHRFLLFLFHTSPVLRLLFWGTAWNKKVLSCQVVSFLWREHSYNMPWTPWVAQLSHPRMLISTVLLTAAVTSAEQRLASPDTQASFCSRPVALLLAGELLQNLYLFGRGGFSPCLSRKQSLGILEKTSIWKDAGSCMPRWLQGCSNCLTEIRTAHILRFLHHLLRNRGEENKHPTLFCFPPPLL